MSLNDENNEHDENIVINIDVDENHNNENIDNFNNKDHENELETILNEINNFSYSVIENNNNNGNSWYSNSVLIAKSIDYDTNYNVKQLLTICDYYGLLKEVKLNKFKKPELILFLLDFEENMENSFIVYKRKQLWHFVEELKNDKFMKKYILW